MVQGTTRREGAQDSLAGYADVKPVTIQGPGTMNANVPTPPKNTATRNVVAQLGKWAGGKMQDQANKENEKAYLEGQLAYQQGQAMEDLDMPGNKWALEGYRQVDAQVMASSMLAAQREEIASSAHTMNPDEFREHYSQRIDGMLADTDERTSDLVREHLMKQMPTLVSDHTASNARYREQENFNSLERSVDIISRDPTSAAELIDFATGAEGSASSGLSDARRSSAVVSGVVRAFTNDNPLAFSALASAGLLGDNLTAAQTNQIRAAQGAFEQRARSTYDEGLFEGYQGLMRQVEKGMDPMEAVESLSILYAEHGINMDMADAGAVYNPARLNERTNKMTRGVLLDEAGARGDKRTQANIIISSLSGTESGGNAAAHRTNVDSRQFGGEIQMGQGRLSDYAKATGTPTMTPAQFAGMTKGEQRAANQWHVMDLIDQANATGAIGSTINGVTVTLSGLVAVAHLGGAGGMRNYVKNRGQNNSDKKDELGTSLTDYLSKHGAGAMDEMFTADEKYDRASDLLEATRDRIAASTYEELAPKVNDTNRKFEAGDITEKQWQSDLDGIYNQYSVARTEADVNAEIATSNGVADDLMVKREKLVEDGNKETEVKMLDAANDSLAGSRLAYEEVMGNPATTQQEAVAATAQLRSDRETVFDLLGIPASKRGNSAATDKMITQLDKSIAANKTFNEEGTRITAAENGGYLGDLSPKLQQRAFDAAKERIQTDASNKVANGTMTSDEADAQIAQDINEHYAKTGAVDPDTRSAMSAAVMRPLVDKEGNPNPDVLDAIQQYMQVKELNPRAARKFLTEEARTVAEAAIARGGHSNLVGEGIRSLDFANKSVGNSMGRPSSAGDDEAIQRRIVQAVQRRVGSEVIDWAQATFESATWNELFDTRALDRDNIESQETADILTVEMQNEVDHLRAVAPNLGEADLVATAEQNLQSRQSFIGGSSVILPRGKDIGTEFYGSRANEMMRPGAINTSIMKWMRSDGFREQYGFAEDTAGLSEMLPEVVQKGINHAVGNIPFSDFEFKPTMSTADAVGTGITGVRPFRVWQHDGGLALEILMPEGSPSLYSEPIKVPMREVGQLDMDSLKQTPKEADPVTDSIRWR